MGIRRVCYLRLVSVVRCPTNYNCSPPGAVLTLHMALVGATIVTPTMTLSSLTTTLPILIRVSPTCLR